MFVFPVGPPFRLRVSLHLDHAPVPHPAHQTGRADFPHPAFGQGLLNGYSHTVAHEQLPLRSLKLVESQLLVQVLVGEAVPPLARYLELRAQPLTHPIASVAVDVPVGLAHRPDAEVVGPAAKFAVDPTNQLFDVQPGFPSFRQLTNRSTEAVDLLPRGTRSQVGLARSTVVVPTEGVTQKVKRLLRQAT